MASEDVIERSEDTTADWPIALQAPGDPTVVQARYAMRGPLAAAYPAGTHDREIRWEGGLSEDALRSVTQYLLAADPRCRRVVLPVPERDLDAIAFAEAAGYRYVVDVETAAAEQSLLVAEPDWVEAQPSAIEDIPV